MNAFRTDARLPGKALTRRAGRLSRLFFLLLLLAALGCSDEADDVQATAVPERAGPATTYYVATDGDDDNPGTIDEPWRTVQHAVDSVGPGDTILARGGVYAERVTFGVSGNATAGPITLQSYVGETAILDGGGLTVPDDDSALILIDSQSYLVVAGLELRSYRSDNADRVPIGVYVAGDAHHIELRDNQIHHIENNGGADGNAHGIAVYGTEAPAAIHNLVIHGNVLHDLRLGNSEALVLNGNVRDFTVTDNVVRDSDNIGIDLIGFEGTAPDPDVDQARDGVVSGNVVHGIDTAGNPAYGGEQSAAGIYVDGGARIIIERNIVYDSNFGIEIASEHAGRSTSDVTVRNNLLYRNDVAGLAMGGYDTNRGRTERCLILNNTFFENDVNASGSGELLIQYDTVDNVVQNNLFVAGAQSLFFSNDYVENSGNVVDNNLYFAPAGAAGSTWGWRDEYYEGFDAYRTATGNDAASLFADPLLIDVGATDLHLTAGSPALDRGVNRPEIGAVDLDGNPRVVNGLVDLGAYEFSGPGLAMRLYLPTAPG